jgi:hypothetical protein
LIISGSGLNLPTKQPAPVKELPTDLLHGKKLMEAVDRAMEKHQNEPSN